MYRCVFRIVDARQPRMTAAVARGVETLPRVQPRIARVHRHGVEAPLLRAGLRIERHQVAGRVEIVTGADHDVVADGHRRRRQEVLLAERHDFLVPPLLAGPGVERDEVVVRRDEVEVVAPHRDATIADVRPALGFPEVVPQLVAVVRVERPHVVGRRHIQHAVDHQHGALHTRIADRECRRSLRHRCCVVAVVAPESRAVQARLNCFTFAWLICVSAL